MLYFTPIFVSNEAIFPVATKVPIVEPNDDKKNTSKTFNTRFLYQPLRLDTSSCKLSISETFGLQINACTIPVKSPTPTNGQREVKGAPTKATKTVIGFANAIKAPNADKHPFNKIQEPII